MIIYLYFTHGLAEKAHAMGTLQFDLLHSVFGSVRLKSFNRLPIYILTCALVTLLLPLCLALAAAQLLRSRLPRQPNAQRRLLRPSCEGEPPLLRLPRVTAPLQGRPLQGHVEPCR